MRLRSVALASLVASGCIQIVVNEAPLPATTCLADGEPPAPADDSVVYRPIVRPPPPMTCLHDASDGDCAHARTLFAQRPAGARTWATVVRGPADAHVEYDPSDPSWNSKPMPMVETPMVDFSDPRRLRAVELYPALGGGIVASVEIVDAYGHVAADDDRHLDTSDPDALVRTIVVGCDKPPIATVRFTMRNLPGDSGQGFGAIATFGCD